MPTFEGKKITVGGTDWVVPPMNFKQIKEHKTLLESLGSLNPSDVKSTKLLEVLPVILAAFQRNYPDMTMEKLEEIVDYGNFKAAFEAAMGVEQGAAGKVTPVQ